MIEATRHALFVLYRSRFLVLVTGVAVAALMWAADGWGGLAAAAFIALVVYLSVELAVRIGFGTWTQLRAQASSSIKRAEESAALFFDREEFNAQLGPALNFALSRDETAPPLRFVVTRFDASGALVQVCLDGATPAQISGDALASRLTSRWRPVMRADVAAAKRAGWALVQVVREGVQDPVREVI